MFLLRQQIKISFAFKLETQVIVSISCLSCNKTRTNCRIQMFYKRN